MALAGRRQAFISGLCSPGLDSAFFAVGEILRGPGSFLHPRLSSRLMQRKFSEPNTYIDGLPSRDCQEELYDDVEVSEPMMVSTWTRGGGHHKQSDCPQDQQFPVTYGAIFCAWGCM